MKTRTLLLCIGALLLATLTTGMAGASTLEVVTNNGGNPNPLDAACVQEGEYAMRISTTNGENGASFVEAGPSVGFSNEGVFRASFWFNPSDMFIRHGRRHFLLSATPGITAQTPATQSPFRVSFFRNEFTGERKVNINCKVNCLNLGTCASAATPKLSLGDTPGWSQIQIEWTQNSGPGIFDGVCRISIIDGIGDGQSAEANITNNKYSINSVKLGFLGGVQIDPQSDGQHCYDDFQSFRTLAP